MRAFLGMGSNQGESRRYLREALDFLGDSVVAVSSLYETEPVGGPPDQAHFLDLVVEVDTELSPHELLGVCHRLEAAAHRTRGERFGPRTLDVDILLMGDLAVDEPDLTIPHPRMWRRRFVMEPLAEIAPHLAPEGWEDRVEGWVERADSL